MDENNNNDSDRAKNILEYLDIFGTKTGFYTERKPQFYSVLGGVLSIFTICIIIIIFILLSLKDFERISPNIISSSIPSVVHEKLNLEDEKIWIPMRIIDYSFKYADHEGIIYPVINYYLAERQNNKEAFHCTKKKLLHLELCNETSMINKSDIYSINAPLDQLYCINTDGLLMGGSWDSLFLGYIKVDLYLCQNGEEFNENNPNCTTYEKIKEKIGYNSSLELEIYYPTIQFQPLNYNNPIIILYKQYFYHINKYSNKMDRLFLQKYILNDERGWFSSSIENNSFWGFSSINGDYLINEESESRFYSLNIYLEPGIILYERKYKKLLSILVENLPITYIVFIFLENIAKLFKLAEENKILIKLLFENIQESRCKRDKKLNILNVKKQSKNFEPMTPFRYRKIKSNLNFFKSRDNSQSINIKKKLSSMREMPKIIFKENIIGKKSIDNNINKRLMSRLEFSHGINKQDEEIVKDSSAMNLNIISNCNTKYIPEKLFPYKYYFFSIFIKNLNLKKNNLCFSEKFAKVYSFLTNVMDIRNYLLLQKEFNDFRTKILSQNKLNGNKNIDADSIFKDMNNLDKDNLHIFSQKKFIK